MIGLDLSENTVLAVVSPVIELHDPRDVHRCNDCRLFFRVQEESGQPPAFVGVLCRIHAGRVLEDGRYEEVESVSVDFPHAAYGRKVVAGSARYADGTQEEWRLRADPVSMRFEWTRQPDFTAGELVYRLLVPRQPNTPEYWHSGRGRQIARGGLMESLEPVVDLLESEDETELLFLSPHPRNCFRIEQPAGGAVRIRCTVLERAPLPGEPAWGKNAAGRVLEPVWETVWPVRAGAIAYFNGAWGVNAAARGFEGRRRVECVDATHDFGPFFTQMFLHCLPLNLTRTETDRLAPRQAVLADDGADQPATAREIIWACEFLYLAAPDVAGGLLRNTVADLLDGGSVDHEDGPRPAMSDDAVAETLLGAGRYYVLTNDEAFVGRLLPGLRRCAEHLLALRRPGEPLPVTTRTWEAQGALAGTEPYFTALCFAGLNRLAYIEERLGDPARATQWRHEAAAMQEAALMPYRYGGLWHPERGIFINHLDCREPAARGPRPRNWTPVRAGTAAGAPPVPWLDVALYENVVPFWLGLAEDPQMVEAAYEYIDGHYAYARGRGGADFPPYLIDTFVALLDVCVRHRYNIRGADHLLHAILAHAFDSGAPLTRAPFGGHVSVSPNDYTELSDHARRLPAGMLLENSPYFGLVVNQHYGLDYSHRGWHIGMPVPLPNYPFTRVTNLRHGNAAYAVTWQGRGKVKRILLDGKPHRSAWLEQREGQHEVIVQLG